MNKFVIYINTIIFSSQCFSSELTEFGYPNNVWTDDYYTSLSMPSDSYYDFYRSSVYPFFSDNAPNSNAANTEQDNLSIEAKNAGYLGSYSENTYVIEKHGFITNCNKSNNHYRILVMKNNDLKINPSTSSGKKYSGIIWTEYNKLYEDPADKAKWNSTDGNARRNQAGLSLYGNYGRLVFFQGSAHSNNSQGGYGGGAISIHHDATEARNITLENETLFTQNFSSRDYGGGAIQGREDLGGKTIINGKSWFLGNQVGIPGSGVDDPRDIKGSGGGAIRGKCKFSENSQVYFKGNSSIASINVGDSFTVDNFVNKIGGGGGAICCAPNCFKDSNKSHSDTLLIEILGDATFTENYANRFGGAIYVADGDIYLSPAKDKIVTFHENYAGGDSGAGYRNAIDLSATSDSYSPKLEIKPAGVVVFKDPITSVSKAKTTICPTETGQLDIYCDLFDPELRKDERKYAGTSIWEGGRVNLHNDGWLRLTDSESPSNQITIPASGTLGIFNQITKEGSINLTDLNSSVLEINNAGLLSTNTKVLGAGTIRFLNNSSSFNFVNYSIDHERNISVENSTLIFSNDNSKTTIRGVFYAFNSTINSEFNENFVVEQNINLENTKFNIKSNSILFEKNFIASYNSEDNKAENYKVLNIQSTTLTVEGNFAINGLTLVLG